MQYEHFGGSARNRRFRAEPPLRTLAKSGKKDHLPPLLLKFENRNLKNQFLDFYSQISAVKGVNGPFCRIWSKWFSSKMVIFDHFDQNLTKTRDSSGVFGGFGHFYGHFLNFGPEPGSFSSGVWGSGQVLAKMAEKMFLSRRYFSRGGPWGGF